MYNAFSLDLTRFRRLPPHVDEPGRPSPDSRHLLRRVLLHVPRFDPRTLREPSVLEQEVERLAAELSVGIASAPAPLLLPRPDDVSLNRCTLIEVPEELAAAIHTSFHYLGAARKGSVHLGLCAPTTDLARGLLALATLSDLDIPHLRRSLATFTDNSTSALVLSRLFGFAGAPRNTITYLLGRVFAFLRARRPEVRVLVTYLNPNLGFQGTVYRASNWQLYGLEHKRRYLYLDGNYLTERSAIELFGTNDYGKLRCLVGTRIDRSKTPLRPLEVYAYWLRRSRFPTTPLDMEPAAETEAP